MGHSRINNRYNDGTALFLVHPIIKDFVIERLAQQAREKLVKETIAKEKRALSPADALLKTVAETPILMTPIVGPQPDQGSES